MHQYLLNSVSEDTVGDPIVMDGGRAVVEVYIPDGIGGGSFGGGNVTIQKQTEDKLAWITLEYANTPFVFTSNGMKVIDFIPVGNSIRAVLAGSTSPSNVIAKIC